MNLKRFDFIQQFSAVLSESIINERRENFEEALVDMEIKQNLFNISDLAIYANEYKNTKDIEWQYKQTRIEKLKCIISLRKIFEALHFIYKNTPFQDFEFQNEFLNKKIDQKDIKIESEKIIEITLYLFFGISSVIIFSILDINNYSLHWYDLALTALGGFISIKFGLMPIFISNNKENDRDKIIIYLMGFRLTEDIARELLLSIDYLDENAECFSEFCYIKLRKSEDKKWNDLLDKANDRIRKANSRINELKSEIEMAKSIIFEKDDRISKLEINLKKSSPKFERYEVFGIRPDCFDQEIIKKRYKQLSNIYHPDKSGSDRMMIMVNNAYDEYH